MQCLIVWRRCSDVVGTSWLGQRATFSQRKLTSAKHIFHGVTMLWQCQQRRCDNVVTTSLCQLGELWISWKWFVLIYFFVPIKMSYYWFNEKNCCKKQRTDIVIMGVKKKLLNFILITKKFWKKMQIISIKTCLMMKKNNKKRIWKK